MNRLPLLLACCISVFLGSPLTAARPKAAGATVVLLEGEPLYFQDGHRHKLDLGQILGRNCEIQTPKDASLHLVLNNGSSLVLAPGSKLKLETLDLPPARPRFKATLSQGRVAVFSELNDQAMTMDLGTPEASVSFKRAHLELAVSEEGSQLIVDEGLAQFGDSEHKRSEDVPAFHSCSLFSGRLEHANRLSKREAGEFRQRWQRSLMIHGQRKELLKNLKALN